MIVGLVYRAIFLFVYCLEGDSHPKDILIVHADDLVDIMGCSGRVGEGASIYKRDYSCGIGPFEMECCRCSKDTGANDQIRGWW